MVRLIRASEQSVKGKETGPAETRRGKKRKKVDVRKIDRKFVVIVQHDVEGAKLATHRNGTTEERLG